MAHNDLGAQLLEAGRFDEAAAELKIAAKLDPKAYNPRLNLGVVLLRQRHYADAAQMLEQAIGIDEQQPVACCLSRAGIACPTDLIDRFKHNPGACLPCQFSRVVGGIVVNDNGFGSKPRLIICSE